MGLITWLFDEFSSLIDGGTPGHETGLVEPDLSHGSVPTGPESTLAFIHGVMNASPAQLNHMAPLLEGNEVAAGIGESVGESQQHLLDSNDTHQLIQESNSALISADNRSSEAGSLIADVKSVL